MRLRLSDDILRIIAGLLSVSAACASLFLGNHPITFILGIILIFFLPGYALTRLLFGRDLKLEIFILLSIGLSVIASMLLALILAATSIGFDLEILLTLLLAIILGALLLDKLRHRENRKIELEILWPKRSEVDPVITTVLVFGLIVAGFFAYYIITAEQPSRTHMIIMSMDEDEHLPMNGTVNESIEFKLEVMNGEGSPAQFTAEIYVNDTIADTKAVTLDDMETQVFDLSVIPTDPGRQRISVELYIDGEYYNRVQFFVNILE